MSNDNKQTSVEWYAQRLYDLEIAYNQGVINSDVYIKGKIDAKEQAKEMEKQQRMSDFTMGVTNANRMEATKDAEQWYNETYGGNNV
jgi:hypothetical protein